MNQGVRRKSLLATTALVLAAAPALAQTLPAPNQLPIGMRVIAGQASATTRGANMQVNQQSGRAALDWSSFNIGSQAGVQFQTPGQQSTTLNRVSGPDASVIAGKLSSNGQLVLINQSGVVFMPGAVVDAQSVVVSAAGITEQGMRAGVASGHFVLNQAPRPGAQVVNNGRISVRRAGLAALVAPQVANHGIISAPFGTVKLAGVASHVVDLYGDGLLSIDVSRQTIRDSSGAAELVTNDGVIEAEGGRVTLSTAAVDGIVTNLVDAGGTISADSVGRHGGRVLIDAEGGTAQVTGTITARGLGGSGSVGGQIGVTASEQVNLASGARLDASGQSGGGTVAIGTTLARARGGVGVKALAAKVATVAPGASVSADALQSGNGGRITVLSTDDTLMAGTLSSRGGALSGNGGIVEVSGTLGLALVGRVDVTAAHGNAGGLVIDPTDLVVQSGGGAVLTNGSLNVAPPPPDNSATIDPNVLQAASGNITLISTDNLDVRSGFSLNSHGLLTMTATNGTITVGGAITNSGGGITMFAGSNIFIDAAITSAGALNITSAQGAITQQAGAPIASTGSYVALSAGGVITLADNVATSSSPAAGSLNLVRATGVSQQGGAVITPSLFSSNGITGPVSLPDATNQVQSLGSFAVSGGGFTLVDAVPLLTVSQRLGITGGALALNNSGDIDIAAPMTADGFLSVVSTRGALTQQAGAPITSTTSGILFSAAGVVSLGDTVSATNAEGGSVDFGQNDGVVQTGGSINTPALFSSGTFSGNVALTQSGNTIGSLGNFGVSQGGFTLVDAAPALSVLGRLTVFGLDPVSLTAPRIVIGQGGHITSGIASHGFVELAPAAGGTVTLGSDPGTGFAVTDTTLNAITAGVLRIGAANGSITASTVTVAAPFGVSGPGTLPDLELVSNAGIAVNASLVANTLLLGGSGAVTQGAGAAATIAAAVLGSSSGFPLSGPVTLANTLNAVPELGGLFTTGGGVDLATSGALSVTGPVSTSGGALTLNAAGGDITFAGNVSAGALSLATGSGGNVVQNSGVALTATSITGNVSGGATLTDSFTGTTSLGAFTSGALSLTTAGPLTTTGAVTAGTVILSASGLLDIASAVTGSVIDLSAASVSEDVAAGSLNGTLSDGVFFGLLTTGTGHITGDATLLGANTLTQVQGFSDGGTLSLLNTQSLAIESGVGATIASFRVTNHGSIEIDQPLVIPATGTLDLRADSLVVTGAATSEVTSVPIALIAVAPDDPTYEVALGGSAVSGAGTLALAGPFLPAALRANTLEVGGLPDGTITAANIVIGGASLPATATLLLDASGGATQTGALAVGTLGGQLGGDVVLTGPGNSIGALGNLSVGGNAALVDTASLLTVAGAVTLTGGGTLQIAADNFAFGAGGSIGAGTVKIGPIDAGQTVGIGSASSGNIVLGDLSRITAATLQAGRSGIRGTQDALQIALAGTASFGGTLLLDAAAGGVFQANGTLSAGALGGSSLGAFDIAGGNGNVIAQLDAITATSIDVIDQSAVRVSGIVQATTGPLGLTAPSVSVDSTGQLVASTGTIGLATDALASPRTDAVVAPGTVNISPDRLSTLTVGPAAGQVDLSRVTTGTIDLFSAPGGIVFSGAVVPGAGMLVLDAANDPVSETAADSLTVATLTGIAGSLSMPGGNAIGTLAGFTVGLGNFLLNDANLTVTAPVVASNPFAAQTITLQAPRLNLVNGAAFSLAFNSPASALVLQADTLTGAVNASVPGGTVLLERLTQGAQSFAQSGGITAGTLQIGGTVAGGSALSSTSLSLGTLNGLNVTTLRLEISGAVTQTGAIVAPGSTLTGAAGSVALSSLGNIITALGDFTTTANGNFSLTDAAPLTLAGALLAGTGSVTLNDRSSVGFGLTLAAGSRIEGGALLLDSPVSQGVTQDAASTIGAVSLSGTILGTLLLDGANNAIGAINTLIVGGLLRLSDSATLTENATGILSAGTLSGSFGGDVRLLGATNSIGDLGPITAAGTLSLTAADPTLAGIVQASEISLAVNGLGYLSGSLIATGAPPPGPVRPLFATSGTIEIGPRDSRRAQSRHRERRSVVRLGERARQRRCRRPRARQIH